MHEQKRKCKQTGCTEWFIVSTASVDSDRMLGFSEPEYCSKHRTMHAKSYSRIAVHHIDIQETDVGTEIIRRVEEAKAHGIKMPLGPGGIGQFNREIRPFIASGNPEPARRDFPIAQKDEEILAAMENHQVIILVGPTGSGKSTHVPHMLLRSNWSRRGPIVVTQPRIQATTQIPRFVARLNDSSYGAGSEIGYVHSKEERYDRRTRLLFMTDGKLINDIVSGMIANYSVIMIDEAHERSVNIDLILGLLRDQLYLYPHLRVVIASATIDHDAFRSYFGGDASREVPLILSEGQSFGYSKHWWSNNDNQDEPETDPDWWQHVNDGNIPDREDLPIAIADLVEYLCRRLDKLSLQEKKQRDGHILVFLPGAREIDHTVSEIIARKLPNVLTLPLYARRPLDEQDRALDPTDPKDKAMRRVVVSTNVAETSLTVEGIKFVIDTGYIKESYWNPLTEVTELMTVRHSKAGCKQRWGRAGRLSPGDVYMLYTKPQFTDSFPEHTSPEIARSSLEQVVLTALAAGVRDITQFAWMPLARKDDQERFLDEIKRALIALQARGAVDTDNDLTTFGLELRGVPVDMDIATVFAEGDRYAMGVEVATLLPFLKLDRGLQSVLRWEDEWDSYDELAIRQQHLALVYGCRDDLDVYLKLWMLWEWTSPGNRQQWCDTMGLDYKTFKETIEEERKKLLGSIMDWRKAEQRQIVLEKVDALRLLIAIGLSQAIYTPLQQQQSVDSQTADFQDWESYWEGSDHYQEYEDDFDLDSIYTAAKRTTAASGIFQRFGVAPTDVQEDALVEVAPISICYGQDDLDLFVACHRKANYLRPARAKSLVLNLVRLEHAWLKLLNVQSWKRVFQADRVERTLFYATLARWRDPVEHDRTKVRLFLPWLVPLEQEVSGKVESWTADKGALVTLTITLNTHGLIGDVGERQMQFHGWLAAGEMNLAGAAEPLVGEEITARVIGYAEQPAREPLLLLTRRGASTAAFSRFAKRHRKGDRIQVEMRRILEDPLGRRPVFVVREMTIGLDIPMSAGDFCGDTRFQPYFGLRFEIGQQFMVDIADIDTREQMVFLSRIRSLLDEYSQVSRDLNQKITDVAVVRLDQRGAYLAINGGASSYISFVRRALWPNGFSPSVGELVPARLRFYERSADVQKLRETLKQGEALPLELDLGIELDLRIPPAYQEFKMRYGGDLSGKLLIHGATVERHLDSGGLLLDIEHGLRAFVHADELGLGEDGRLKSAREYQPGTRIDARITRARDEQARIECSIFRIAALEQDYPEVVTARVLMIRPDRRDPERHYITCSLDNTYRIQVQTNTSSHGLTVDDLVQVRITKVYRATVDIKGELITIEDGSDE